jgi:putative inorganic carbon (HCO3(-)) transporter
MNQEPQGLMRGFAAMRAKRTTLAYRALVLFSAIYFLRPEDFIPGLVAVPIGKIAGGITLLALIFGTKPKGRGKLPMECKLLLVLLVHMILTIPMAYWRGGAFDTVINKFSKGVIVALLLTLVVTQVNELRKLLYIQSAAVAVIAVVSILVHHTVEGRLMGIQKGILENPNDLAINIAINFPLCMAFLFAAKGGLRKFLWTVALLGMLYAVVATYSRSGMIAMVITGVICLWEFGVRGKRMLLLMSTAIVGVFAVVVMLATPHYLIRLESLVRGNIEGSGDKGSMEARSELLRESLRLMVHHPIFGVGPGNFGVITEEWRVAHNTYTELGAETGFPGLILFCAVLFSAVRRIRRVRKLPGYAANENIRLWTSALWAALAAYLAGAMFASTEYNLFPYFMVGYICALYQIASKPPEENSGGSGNTAGGGTKELGHGGNKERELAWSR